MRGVLAEYRILGPEGDETRTLSEMGVHRSMGKVKMIRHEPNYLRDLALGILLTSPLCP